MRIETTARRAASKDRLIAELGRHTGSLDRIRHWTRRLIYTPGVQYLAEATGAFWLIDLVAAHCGNPRLVGEAFQVWTLAVAADRSATLTVTDGNTTTLLRKDIHGTDFPLDTISLYLIEGTLLLPSEY